MRWVAWVNGWPFILGAGMEPTEENVNMVRKAHSQPPLGHMDEITAITQAGPNFAPQFEWARKYYPEGYTVLEELAEVVGQDEKVEQK